MRATTAIYAMFRGFAALLAVLLIAVVSVRRLCPSHAGPPAGDRRHGGSSDGWRVFGRNGCESVEETDARLHRDLAGRGPAVLSADWHTVNECRRHVRPPAAGRLGPDRHVCPSWLDQAVVQLARGRSCRTATRRRRRSWRFSAVHSRAVRIALRVQVDRRRCRLNGELAPALPIPEMGPPWRQSIHRELRRSKP